MHLCPAILRRAREQLNSRDPERDGLHRALRAAIVIPIAVAVSFAFGPPEAPFYALFGSFAILVLADFPGDRPNRVLAYAGLAFNVAVLMTLGTLVAPIPWLSVPLMFCVGAAVTFAGVLSETLAAGQRAHLLMFVLPTVTPTGPVGERLIGWLIALAICVPASLFFLPPRHHDALREDCARVCAVLADLLNGTATGDEATTAMDALRADFMGAEFRPVGLSASSRSLVRAVDDLQWITDRVKVGVALGETRTPAIRVLRAAAGVLSCPERLDLAASSAELHTALAELQVVAHGGYHEDIIRMLGEADDQSAVEVGQALLTRRAIASTVGTVGRVIAIAVAADARPVWARALGRQLPATGASVRVLPATVAVAAATSSPLVTRAVAVHNSVRTGLGLAAAVALTHLLSVEYGPWVVLAASSVLRSSALTTGTTTVRAVTGTFIGFLVGSALMMILGVEPVALWILLPIVIFGSAYVPEIASFIAAQAAFTMMLLIFFNLISPVGLHVGVIRVQEVIVGTLIAVFVSLLLWPQGAAALVNALLVEVRDVGCRYLRAAVLRVTRGTSEAIDDEITALSHEALVASRVLDDAVRQYLSESGGATDVRAPAVRALNRTVRLRSAADRIADIAQPPPPTSYPRAKAVLETHAEALCDRLAGQTDRTSAPISSDLVLAMRAEATGEFDVVAAALPLVTVAANLAELELEVELMYPTTKPMSVAR